MEDNSKVVRSVLICNGNEPLPKQGGMERVSDALARGLLSKGVNVYFLCRNHNRLGEKYDSPCPIYFIPKDNQHDYLKKLITELKITHIIDQGEGELVGKFGYFKKRESCFENIKLIAVQHNNARSVLDNFFTIYGSHSANAIKRWIYNNTILRLRYIHSCYQVRQLHVELSKNYDNIVQLSANFIPDFITFVPDVDKSKLLAIPNMNSFASVEKAEKENRVLFVGRLISSVKGCDKLLRIWKNASQGIDNWTLDIVGDGPDKLSLINIAKSLNLNNVMFHGFKNPAHYYAKSKILCLTSVYEGFGMVLTEAMQHGTVPIAFNSYKALKDIIENKVDGCIIDAFDEQSFASSLRNLMLDDALRNSMSKNALQSVNKFSIDNIISKWLKILN